MNELELNLLIEGLREHMIKLASERGNLVDPNVVEISQRLDQLIVQAQKLKVRQTIQWSKVG